MVLNVLYLRCSTSSGAVTSVVGYYNIRKYLRDICSNGILLLITPKGGDILKTSKDLEFFNI
jgi:hypothetical protein